MSQEPRTTFVELMALEDLGDGTYVSKTRAWAPLVGGAAFGGHVYAQAVWAASQLVEEGMIIHNIHGYFTRPGAPGRPFVYKVESISDGRSYCTRSVSVRQPTTSDWSLRRQYRRDDLEDVCFSCICSFKKDEIRPTLSHQEVKDWDAQYGTVLQGKLPMDHATAPAVDLPWYYVKMPTSFSSPPCPGVDIRKVDMLTSNQSTSPMDYRQLQFYKAIGTIPSSQPNLHACAHLYASDRNGLFLISHALGFADQAAKIASISHSVIFHVGSKAFKFRDDIEAEKEESWFCQEAWTPRSEGGRGVHQSKIWDDKGVHIASTWQDGLVRKAETEAEMEGKIIEAVSRGKRGLGRTKL